MKYTPRLTSAANIALFRFANRDMFGNLDKLYRTVTRTCGPLVLHFHVLHSYWLNLEEVVTFCQKVKAHKPDITFVWTLHDHWSVTGRCAFTDGCEGWRTGCQKCPTLSNYPPVKVDKAHQQLPGKRQMFRAMLALGCQFISPSQHVADAFNILYGVGRCRVINNGIDVATEAILAELPAMPAESGRPKIAVVAHDLRYDGKTSQQLVRAISALGDKIELHTFGKFSPFAGDNVINHGFESDKRTLMSALNQMDGLVFSSCVDNYPLILCEALSIGVPVIATHSDAAQEVLAKSGGKTFSEADVLQLVQLKKSDIAQAVFDTSLTAFSQRSRVAYSGQQMRSIRICSYLVLPLLYLLVNVKLAQLGESFPITIVTFLPALLLLFVERINIKKLMIALGVGGGLTAFNYLFGQSLDASKYVTSAMLFVYTVVIIGMVWSIRFKTISPHNYIKILRFFWLVVGLVVGLAAVEMAQIILSGGSSLMEVISKYLIYSNSYVLNFIKFGGKRTTALYFEPAFFALALISIWLSIKQFGIKTPKSDAMILAGIILSGSFSGVMTFILFYLLEWAFQYLNKDAIKKKLPLAIISLSVFLVGVIFAFPYIATRLGDLGTEGSSSYYRIVGPLVMVGYSLLNVDGVVRFGSLYEYVASFGISNGADVGKTIDNGLYLLIIYFSWFAVILALWYMGKVMKMMINAFGDNQNYRVQLYLFTPLSLFFTGSVFSPEYAFLIVCPFILRKALNIAR
ncbi:putative colanic acid polymerase WcaD [Escherichia coli]|nr:putative colanic acid polymerase WcaD [Escherichia coli]